MKKLTASDELAKLISEKEAEIKQERVLLNALFLSAYHHLQPVTLIKNKLRNIIADTELITDLQKASVNIATTVVTGIILQATRNQPIKRGIGLLSSLAIRYAASRFFASKERQ